MTAQYSSSLVLSETTLSLCYSPQAPPHATNWLTNLLEWHLSPRLAYRSLELRHACEVPPSEHPLQLLPHILNRVHITLHSPQYKQRETATHVVTRVKYLH